MRRVWLFVLGILVSNCAPMTGHHAGTVLNSKVRVFPSPLASDSDFINLVSEDRALRALAFKDVSIYYNCLVKASRDSRRQDPTLINRSQIVAFSEIPSKIYDTRMEKLASLITDQNKAAVQSVIDMEIKYLSSINWNDIKKEVNSIVAGGRNMELEKYPCPLSDSELEPQSLQLTQEWWLLRPVFIPPFM